MKTLPVESSPKAKLYWHLLADLLIVYESCGDTDMSDLLLEQADALWYDMTDEEHEQAEQLLEQE